MRLIAIAGMTGSGKTELASIFEKHGYRVIRFGDITEEIMKKEGMDINEENERKIRESLRKKHGMDAYAKENYEKIAAALETKNVVIDGLYSWEEYIFLKDKFPDMILLAVYAPPITRYERLEERMKRGLTREQARKRDETELKNLNKGAPIAMADYTLLNVWTLADLENSYDKFMEWMREKDEADMG